MTTHYGINPSFVFNSPLPLFRNLIRRAKRPAAEDGTIRLFNEQAPAVDRIAFAGCRLSRSNGGALTAQTAPTVEASAHLGSAAGTEPFHLDSLNALKNLRPKVLRTLDWEMTNHRRDWSKPRTQPSDLLQGTEHGMAVELQAQVANLLGCHLWWCAPPRFELSVEEYERRLEEYLRAIQATAKLPPILEYGNELWNDGFAVKRWLQQISSAGDPNSMTTHWHVNAACEIATLKRVADRVFGTPMLGKSYYLFVGGQLTVPSHMDKILDALADLGVTPDLAGPALYVTPLKAQKEEWEATGAVPTQEELRDSCFARLDQITGPNGPLYFAKNNTEEHGVPYFACYEAGQSLIAGAHPWRRAALEAQKTEWMGDLMCEIMRTAESAEVDLLNWYSASTNQAPGDSRVDVFGLLGAPGEPVYPKALAVMGKWPASR